MPETRFEDLYQYAAQQRGAQASNPPAQGYKPPKIDTTPAPVPKMPESTLFSDQEIKTPDTMKDLEKYAARAPDVQSQETVQGQLTDLFSNKEMNPLFEHAQSKGELYAHSRGLQNSSMAAEAATGAIYDFAFPIASEDANIYAARAQSEAEYWQNAGLQAQDAAPFVLAEVEPTATTRVAPSNTARRAAWCASRGRCWAGCPAAWRWFASRPALFSRRLPAHRA